MCRFENAVAEGEKIPGEMYVLEMIERDNDAFMERKVKQISANKGAILPMVLSSLCPSLSLPPSPFSPFSHFTRV